MDDITIVIETDGTAIDVSELVEFLELFRVAYGLSADERYVDYRTIFGAKADEIAAAVRDNYYGTNTFSWTIIDAPIEFETAQQKLKIKDINRENPLTLVFAAIPVALTAAVILSGGTIKIGGVVSAKLPPLGTGITALRKSLGFPPRKKPPSD